MLDTQSGKKVGTTRYDYDFGVLKSALKGIAMSIGFTLFSFFKSQKRGGMMVQIFMTPFNLFKNNLFKAYILGEDLPRPFPATGLMAQMTNAMKELDGQKPDPNVAPLPFQTAAPEQVIKDSRTKKREEVKQRLDKQNPHMSEAARVIHMERAGVAKSKQSGPRRNTRRRR